LLGGGDLEVGVVHLVVLDGRLRRQLKNGRQLSDEKFAPQTKSWLRLWAWNRWHGIRV